MRIWIDATGPSCELRIFGMTLLERQFHTLLEADLQPTDVYVQLASETAHIPTFLPSRLIRSLPVRWGPTGRTFAEYIASIPENAGDDVIALEANAVVDSRLLRALTDRPGSWVARSRSDVDRTALLRLEIETAFPEWAASERSKIGRLSELADRGMRDHGWGAFDLTGVPSYIRKLRRNLPVYLFRVVGPDDRDQAERFLFWSNYKGSTDFFTKYVYPPLVWRAVRPLARWRVHPNVVSLFNVAITFAAVPLFGAGYWAAGFILAYTMSVLDSVDGKLARLTFNASKLGDVLDHGLDIVHPPLWYLAWAWALRDGSAAVPIMLLAYGLTGLYVLDRIVAAIFSVRLGQSIHGYRLLDRRMRTFISRRNINLPVFMLGLLAGVPVQTFVLITVWQAACLGFHTWRLLRFWHGRPEWDGGDA